MGFVRRGAVPFGVAGFHVQMKRHLVVHVAIELPATHDGAKAPQQLQWGDHRPAPRSTRFPAPEYVRQASVSFASARLPAAESW